MGEAKEETKFQDKKAVKGQDKKSGGSKKSGGNGGETISWTWVIIGVVVILIILVVCGVVYYIYQNKGSVWLAKIKNPHLRSFLEFLIRK